MKCNIANVWKRELFAIKQKKDKEITQQIKKQKDELIIKLKSDGWQFKYYEYSHSHNNSDEGITMFKSPRMKNFSAYYENDDMFLSESKCVAKEYFDNTDNKIQKKARQRPAFKA